MDIAAWLQGLGLKRYEPVFRESEIDWEVLPELTEGDLEKLGLPLGPRKKLLKAIAALAASSEPVAESTVAPPAAEAERRQLTVMFVDLVGSTALSGKLDPEEMREVIHAYQNAVAGEIARLEGHVAKFMGDGVLAYFGWPRAHEDEAERAVRAGLSIMRLMADMKTPAGEALAARAGIATGLVVVGDLVGEGAAQEDAVVGETPNLAARLQGLAEPGAVVIAASTRRLLGELFELTDLSVHELKGFADPVQAWQVTGESGAESRFEALHGAGVTPLIGRDEEFHLLLSRWRRAEEGEGQAVLLSGEPGIGKSRLIHALLERLAAEPHVRLRYYCSPYHTNSAMHPVIEQLERAAGFAADDGADAKLDKLEAVLRQSSDQVAEVAPLLAALCSLSTGGHYPPLDLTPQAQKAKTFEALLAQLEGLTASQPVLMVLEDAHWIDPTSAELFGQVIDRVTRLPVLLVITFRPEFDPPWTGHAHVTQLSLNRLSLRHGEVMIERLTAGKALPAEVLEQIVARTDGVPLFVEELTKTILESGLLKDTRDSFELASPLPPLAIPATLHDSLMARLDRLAPVKEVAQIGAVIGREFHHDLVASVTDRPETELASALEQLVAAELIFCRGTPPSATYTFKHALVQDAAYQSLLRNKRHALHAKVAAVIEQARPATAQQEPELLAYHLSEAGETERAIGYWRAAAQQASERSAHKEAVAHLRKSVQLLSELPESEERDRLELQIQINLGSAFVVLHGYAAAAAEEAYERARELAQRLDEQAQLFTAIWGLWMSNQMRMQVTTGRALADELLAVAERGADGGQRLEAHHAAWTTLLFVPDLAACHRHTEQGLALYDPDRHAAHKFQYGGHDPGVCGRVHRGHAEWLLGFPNQALDHMLEAVNLARDLGHGPSLAIALSLNSYVYRFRGEIAAARERSEEQIRLCVEQGIFPQHVAFGRIGQGWAMARGGDLEDALVTMRQGLDELERTKVQLRRAYHVAMFAEVCIQAGRYDEGRRALTAALETAERWWEPEIHRLRGALVLAEDASAIQDAEQQFQRALTVAQGRQSRSLELRAATSLARLCAEQGGRQKAHDLLAPIYEWFTEGFDTADLKEAKALLDELI